MGAILDRLDDDENARRLLRARLSEALEQARTGDLAEGDGETAMRRAFAAGIRAPRATRRKWGRHGP